MEPRFSLLQMRDVWIDAYRRADVDQLAFVANPHFFVQHEDRIRTKAQYLARMRTLTAERTSNPFLVTYRDEAIRIVEHERWATISGSGSVRQSGRLDSRFDFLELWCVSDTRWQIAALCFEHTKTG